MLKTLILSGFFLASSAQAATFDFTYFGTHSGGYSMVSCDYAERQAEELFSLYGAKNIRVDCSGGIQPPGTIVPLSLRIRYTPVVLGSEYRTVRENFRSDVFGNGGCDFNSKLVRQSVRKVSNVKLVRASDFCSGGSQRFDFSFSVKLP